MISYSSISYEPSCGVSVIFPLVKSMRSGLPPLPLFSGGGGGGGGTEDASSTFVSSSIVCDFSMITSRLRPLVSSPGVEGPAIESMVAVFYSSKRSQAFASRLTFLEFGGRGLGLLSGEKGGAATMLGSFVFSSSTGAQAPGLTLVPRFSN